MIQSKRMVFYKRLIWLYIILFIFEGTLRKWIFPDLSTPLLLIREPIVVYLVYVALAEGWLRNNIYVHIFMFIGTLSFILSLLFGHHNVLVGLFGWRIYFFHFPFIVVASKILDIEDVVKIGRFLLYISIPMTLLIIMQFYSPQEAWINRGVGGATDLGFGGALGYFRPPGTFSFTSVYSGFQCIVCSFLAYYLLENKTLPAHLKINKWLLLAISICYILSIPYSMSRTVTFMTALICAFSLLSSLKNRKHFFSMLGGFLILGVGFYIAYSLNLFGDSLDAFSTRFENASETEGGLQGTLGHRYIGGFINSLTMDVPFWGYGIGIGTNVGAALLKGDMFTFFNAESGFGQIIGECGLLIGLIIIMTRIIWGGQLFIKALKRINHNTLAWLLMPGMLTSLPLGSTVAIPSLGILVINSFLAITALHKKNKNIKTGGIHL